MVRKPINSLVVLGNGFDLNCKLPSKFSDFFETKFEEAKRAADANVYATCSNLWYLLFFFSYYDNFYYESKNHIIFERIQKDDMAWMDVEDFIKKIVIFDRNQDNWMKSNLPLRFNNYRSLLAYLCETKNDTYVINQQNQYSAIRRFFKLSTKPFSNIDDFLYKELLAFENDFNDYLSKEIGKSKNYATNYEKLLGEIIDAHEQFSIISFNYTPFLGGDNYGMFKYDFYNIHGELNKGIIIGFDASDVDGEKNHSIILSKAWQKMNTSQTHYQLPSRAAISSLKFYGHSLGKQDYSYFHAIFDHYDIYDSNIKLIFYYTEYGKSVAENSQIKSRYITQIYNLLNDYTIKSGKEKDVKTIVGRLHLENRLMVAPIPLLPKEG